MISRILDVLYAETYTGQSGGKINYLLKNFSNVSVLVIGDSRSAHHVVPENIGAEAYNLSHNGQSLIFHTGLLDQLVRNEKVKIDTILLHIERDEVFSEDATSNQDIQHLKYYYDKNNWIKNEIDKLSRFEFVKYLFSSYKWNGKVLNIIRNRIKSDMDTIPPGGYVALPQSRRDSINVIWSYNQRTQSESESFSETINGGFDRYLQAVSDLCKEHGIVLVCFTSPIYNPANVAQNSDRILESYFAQKGIPYFDYWNLFHLESNLQSPWVWHNSQHLNQAGALIFSDIVRKDLSSYPFK